MPNPYDEARTLRRRVAGVEEALARELQDTKTGCVCRVAKTVTMTAYPTTAGNYYALQPVRITGVIAEATAPTLTANGDKFLAYNLGASVPPLGTYVVAVGAGGRWTFRYG